MKKYLSLLSVVTLLAANGMSAFADELTETVSVDEVVLFTLSETTEETVEKSLIDEFGDGESSENDVVSDDEPVEPIEPAPPVEPAKPIEPVPPVEPVKPVEPSSPVEPVLPDEPLTHSPAHHPVAEPSKNVTISNSKNVATPIATKSPETPSHVLTELPQTGGVESASMSVLGLFVLVGTVVFSMKKRKG